MKTGLIAIALLLTSSVAHAACAVGTEVVKRNTLSDRTFSVNLCIPGGPCQSVQYTVEKGISGTVVGASKTGTAAFVYSIIWDQALYNQAGDAGCPVINGAPVCSYAYTSNVQQDGVPRAQLGDAYVSCE